MASPTIERLGKYRVTQVLGEGAMGVVYKGFDPDIHRDVALKTMRANMVEPESGLSFAERFRNEARAAGRLQHPGIVGVYDFGHDAGVDFIAMEYVPGHTLSRYLLQVSSGKLSMSDDDVLSIIGQLLEALHHAHEQGVWHRDIKPSNLIMTPEGKIKVSDFGIARIVSSELTQAGGLIGTPMYMSPERFLGQPIDRRIDIYAAGVILYQLLTGRPPFTGAPEALMYKAVHDPAVLPSQIPGLEHLAPYDTVLDRALAKKPENRFEHAMAFRDALVAVVGRMHNAVVSDATVTALLPMRRSEGYEPNTASSLPTHFDTATLAQVVSTLARHLGPMAQVLVKRAARDCPDLPSLYARLAEQVTDPAARQAFMQQAGSLRTGTLGSLPGTGVQPGKTPTGLVVGAPPTAATPMPAPGSVDTVLMDAAQRLLAQRMGPIAKVVVKKAAVAAPSREAFIQQLLAQVDDATARQQLGDALRAMKPSA
jgi:serine/threonine-protein kinase